MNVFAQTLDKLRGKPDRSFTARPFSGLSAHRTIRQHQKIGAMLGIESPFFRSTEGPQGRKTLIDGRPVINFAWCDHLGLSQRPDLVAAAKTALGRQGED